MKTSSIALALAASLSTASAAYWTGFNILSKLPNGNCKSQSDYETDFKTMKSLPGGYTSIRVYASSDCNTLANAVPAAIASGGKILAGVWTEDAVHYDAEKQALLSAVKRYGFGWLIAVSVGSEDLYRNDTSASTLAQQIYDVRGMLSTVSGYSSKVQVGHTDTWTMWVNSSNTAVIKACDFVGTDGYPYWQAKYANNIKNGESLFWESVDSVRSVMNKVKPGTWVWITETGWPVSGPTENQAVASIQNAQTYWSSVACESFRQAHTFWYTLQDVGTVGTAPSFGVVDANFKPLYNLTC